MTCILLDDLPRSACHRRRRSFIVVEGVKKCSILLSMSMQEIM